MPTLEEAGSAATSSESRYHSCSLLLQKSFNDFPTSCFIFMSPVLSVYCKGLPASENDQLCMPLNMYICAFVYAIGVHYFFLSSKWFTKKIKGASSLLVNGPDAAELRQRRGAYDPLMTSCVTSPQIPSLPQPVKPINTACLLPPSLRGHFLLAPPSI